MDREEVMAGMIATINNVNDKGLTLISALIGMEDVESYNITTSPERLAEIEENRKREDQEHRKERRRKEMDEEIAWRKKQIDALECRDRIFWNKIQKVGNVDGYIRYDINTHQLMLLAELFNNNLLNGSVPLFRYGFHQGMQYMKNREKKSA